MKEAKLRKIVRQELIREQVGGQAIQEIRSYLDTVGEREAGGYKYKGYHFSMDSMGGDVGFVSMFRGLYDEEPAVTATIDERGSMELTKGGSGPPDERIPDYRSGEAVIEKMIQLA